MRHPQLSSLLLALLVVLVLAGCGGNKSVAGIKPSVHGKWTVLVFLNAANDLDAYSPVNVAQMQQAASNPDVRFVVQWKQSTKVSVSATFNGTRRYLITPSSSSNVVSTVVEDMGTGVDMGVPQTLNDFIKWGKGAYPADHYAVILWDHGNGWLPKYKQPASVALPPAFSYDDETGHSIQIWQLNQCFQGQHVDIAAFDASLMQMSEVAYQLKDYADYIAGSEESPPGLGYPYQRLLGEFAGAPDASARTLSKAFVDAMVNEPTYSTEKVTQSVIDASQMPSLASTASALSAALVSNATAIDPIILQVRTNSQAYSPTNTRYFFDSIDLCQQILAHTNVTAVQTACANYINAAKNAIVWEGHNSHSPGSHGIAIDFSPSSYFTTVSSQYSQLDWNTASNWGQWLSVAP